MTSDLASSWIDVDPSSCEPARPSVMQQLCPLPLFSPNFATPPDQPVMVARTVLEMRQGLQREHTLPELHRSLRDSEIKTELHRVLQSVQCSSDYGVYFCESFRDPRRHYIDDYWSEVSHEAFGIEELHHLVGKVNNTPVPDEARARLHEFARLLDRLARRIDRVVLSP